MWLILEASSSSCYKGKKINNSWLRCKLNNSKTSSLMLPCNWMEAPFVYMTLKKIAFKVDNSEKWRIVSAKAMELH